MEKKKKTFHKDFTFHRHGRVRIFKSKTCQRFLWKTGRLDEEPSFRLEHWFTNTGFQKRNDKVTRYTDRVEGHRLDYMVGTKSGMFPPSPNLFSVRRLTEGLSRPRLLVRHWTTEKVHRTNHVFGVTDHTIDCVSSVTHLSTRLLNVPPVYSREKD